MKKIIIAAAIALISATTAVSASPFSSPYTDPNVLVNKPIIQAEGELILIGDTGHIDQYFIELGN